MRSLPITMFLVIATFRLNAEDPIKINVCLSIISLNELVRTINGIDKLPIASISTKTTPMVRNNDPNVVAVFTGKEDDPNVISGNYFEMKLYKGKWSVIYKNVWKRSNEVKSISVEPVIQ